MQTNINNLVKELELIKNSNEKLFFTKLRELEAAELGAVLLELSDSSLEDSLDVLKNEKISNAIGELESDDATDLMQTLEDIDPEKAQLLLNQLDLKDQIEINTLKQYEDNQAGAYMQKELLKANHNDTVEEFINRIKSFDIDLDTVTQLYIVNNQNSIEMTLPITKLLILDSSVKFKNIWTKIPEEYIPKHILDSSDVQEALRLFEEYDLSSLPVIDSENSIVGRITYDDIYDLIEEKATKDIYNLAGVNDEAEEDTNLFRTIKTRFNWLFINLITSILASLGIALFSDAITEIVALAILMPIIASMGGNSGTQSLAVTVRKIALGDIDKNNAYATLKKEFLISLTNSILFAIILGTITYLWFHSIGLSIIVCIAIIANLIVAGIFGALIPLLLKSIKIDPAIGSTVVLTTITDVVGFMSFLGLAKAFIL
ncbi:MAG: Mg/Co/Ni transporter MgtE / CBS domain [uncultured Campylobacterales bacterium]|uniref:Magnesium transporter MgtE n=1 Tax=uncultured Campylobacterales bacterium TaxID=352960 RepID=A0A6S6SA63_9BACT|nr:MAG: Mg/Co/Ni transporter MgtE / CBS domain [uncultured Campylobacterales bacterium]